MSLVAISAQNIETKTAMADYQWIDVWELLFTHKGSKLMTLEAGNGIDSEFETTHLCNAGAAYTLTIAAINIKGIRSLCCWFLTQRWLMLHYLLHNLIQPYYIGLLHGTFLSFGPQQFSRARNTAPASTSAAAASLPSPAASPSIAVHIWLLPLPHY